MPFQDDSSHPKQNKPASVVQPENKIVATGAGYDTNLIDTRYQDRASLLKHIGGSAWYVAYFQQVLGEDDKLTPLALDKDPIYQQYVRIEGLELRVTSPITANQDEATTLFEAEGVAQLYPILIPNKGDMFIADIGDGNAGLFTVTRSQRKTLYADSAYEIGYTLVDYAKQKYVINLQEKTVRQTYYVESLLEKGQNPIVDSVDFEQQRSFSSMFDELLDQYLTAFYSRHFDSLMVPDQLHITYDPFLVKAMLSFIDTNTSPMTQYLRAYRAVLPTRTTPKTIWDAFLTLSMDVIRLTNNRLVIVDAYYFGDNPNLDGAAFSGIEDIVYPVDRGESGLPESTDAIFNIPAGGSRGFTPTRQPKTAFDFVYQGDPDQTAPVTALSDETMVARPWIYPVTQDDFYVLSRAFYEKDVMNQSRLEELCYRALTQQGFNSDTLMTLCSNSQTWGRLERFYYTPILLILLLVAKRDS